MTGAQQVHVNALGAVMGGAARHLGPFLTGLHSARPEWDLHVWVYEEAATDGWPRPVAIHTVPWRSQIHRFRWENLDLPRELRSRHADVLVNLTNSAPLRSPVPSLLYQRNALWFDRGWLAGGGRSRRLQAGVRRALTFAQARGAAMVVVPSQAMGDFLRSWRGWPRRVPIRVIPHAVDTDRFVYTERAWPPSDRPVHLLAVGHDAPHKDQLLLIDLVAELRRRDRPAELVLTIETDAPSGYVAELVARAATLGLRDAVHFVGTASDAERLYAEADLALSASISESFGFPILEAMASGVPVVASAIPATVEVGAGLAWLFPVGDVHGAADAVDAALLLPPDALRDRLAEAHDRAATFTWTRNVDAVIDAVEDVLVSRG